MRGCCIIGLLMDLGIHPDFKSFKDRLLAQKVVYLAQRLFNMNFGYEFIWHIRGPYSKALSRDLRAPEDYSTCRCPEIDGRAVARMKSLLNELRGLDMDLSLSLEILASYLMLSKDVYPRPEDPVKELLSRKPYVSQDDVDSVLSVSRKYLTG